MIDRSFAGLHRVAGLLVVAGWLVAPAPAAAEDGKQLFEDECSLCHKIGGGRGPGPDLAGITEKQPEEWLIRYVKSSDAMVQSGDARAKANRESFKREMPDTELSEPAIKAILGYIRSASGSGAPGKTAAAPAAPPSAEDIRLGQQLFEGSVRFEQGGPACNACHDINHPGVTGGGVLAKDLTHSHSTMDREAFNATLAKASFPVMRVAYQGIPISDREMKALAGFMQAADQDPAPHEPRSHGWRTLLGGVAGLAVLLGLLTALGGKRRKRSVNQDIHDRQLRSE